MNDTLDLDLEPLFDQNDTEKSWNMTCDRATDQEMAWFDNFSYWTEGVVQLGLGKKYIKIQQETTVKMYLNFRNCWLCGQLSGDPSAQIQENEQYFQP